MGSKSTKAVVADLKRFNRRSANHVIHGRPQPEPSFLNLVALGQESAAEIRSG
jgi:hypothetical protein